MFSRLFTIFLQIHGFMCEVDDLLISEDLDLRRKDILETGEKESEQVHLQFTNNNSVGSTDLQKEIEKVIRTNVEPETARLDRMMSSKMNVITSEANNALFPTGLVKSFPANCLSLMTVTGAKEQSNMRHHHSQLPCLQCHPQSYIAYIRMVQHLIERCLILRMNRDDCVQALAQHACIQPLVTLAVWKGLLKENKGFFHSYLHEISPRH
ncbi:DNA-directed RNA polymerase I subunit 1-like isoform X1 [Dioscorea cayenensis subsp. rotundata]|uniref:DNA-directed RNA polymerase n=1 Tax=Dioscorea cayennensis subsp. rotundata TaxID=55577 RepID=A0AB40CHI3_DIOCR|nr:DNA-directed RNA polymerase I subunit 1-like isoform X1 [Dioscorea cayenensis subsp. rotundata]